MKALHNIKFDTNIGALWIDEKPIKSVTGIDLSYKKGSSVVEVTLKVDANVKVNGKLILCSDILSDEKIRKIINLP